MTTENPCPLCDRPIADTAYVCHRCSKDLAKRLLLAGTQWESIEDAIGHGLLVDLPPSTPKATDGHVYLGPWCWGGNECEHTSCARAWRSVTHQRVEPPGAHEDHGPLSFEASDDAWTARNTFTTWARHVEEERGITSPIDPEPAPPRELVPPPRSDLEEPRPLCRFSDLPLGECACGHDHEEIA